MFEFGYVLSRAETHHSRQPVGWVERNERKPVAMGFGAKTCASTHPTALKYRKNPTAGGRAGAQS